MKIRVFLLLLMAQLLVMPAYAEDEPEVVEDEIRYLDIKPAIVTNYGGPGRMSYIKVEVSLQVDSQEEFTTVFHHFPSIRHELVMLFGQQTDESIAIGEPREAIRAEALAKIRAIMMEEEEAEMVDDLLFSSFFVQR
ncbi:MAG: flagellar basal body-associated FliL family protein [Pseudomonadales bacterium]